MTTVLMGVLLWRRTPRSFVGATAGSTNAFCGQKWWVQGEMLHRKRRVVFANILLVKYEQITHWRSVSQRTAPCWRLRLVPQATTQPSVTLAQDHFRLCSEEAFETSVFTSKKNMHRTSCHTNKNWCIFCKVESVTLNNADGTTAVLSSSDKLLKYNRGENLNLNTNASVCTKKKMYSFCTYSTNLQITSRLKTVICSSLCWLTSLRWVHVKSIQMWHSEMALCARFCTAKEASPPTPDRRAWSSIFSR